MKVNKFGMLIKFAAFYLCINFIVNVSAIPLDDKKAEKQSASVEDYDATSIEKSTEASSSDTKPPLLFPTDDEKSTSKNETALEILQKNSNTSAIDEKNSTSVVEKEVNKSANDTNNDKDYDDEREKGNDKGKAAPEATTQKDKQKYPKQEEVKTKNTNDTKEKDYDEEANENSGDDKDDAENIQENQEQGDLEEKYGVNSTSINVFEEPTIRGRHIAFIFATSILFLSATAYVGLIVWRKTLEHRYGMRQRLVTEDDYYNNNDVRFFGL